MLHWIPTSKISSVQYDFSCLNVSNHVVIKFALYWIYNVPLLVDYKGNNIWFNYEQGDGSVDIAFDSKEWRHFPGNEGLLEPKYVLPFFIHKVLPKLKVIIMLRDPVERYNYNIEVVRISIPNLDLTLPNTVGTFKSKHQ